MVKTSVLLIIVTGAPLISGCDLSPYTPTATTNGAVVITNRFTGATSQVKDGFRLDTPEKPAEIHANQIELPNIEMGNIPFRAVAAIKYADDKMLIRFSISPPLLEKKRIEEWRLYVLTNRFKDPSPKFNLEFLDGDEFVRLTRIIEIDDMKQIVDSDGKVQSLSYQESIPMAPDTFSSLTDWSVGWGNGWSAWHKPTNTSPDALQKEDETKKP